MAVLLRSEFCYMVLTFVEDEALWGLSCEKEITQTSQRINIQAV